MPLERIWTFWFAESPAPGRGMTKDEYGESLNNIGSFGTVQKFWRYYNNLPSLDKISVRSTMYIMREGITPAWEDEHNTGGGIVNIKLNPGETNKAWEYLALFAIGEKLSVDIGDDQINGVGVSIRRKGQDYLQVWNYNSLNYPKIKQRIIDLFKLITPSYVEESNMFYTAIREKLSTDQPTRGGTSEN